MRKLQIENFRLPIFNRTRDFAMAAKCELFAAGLNAQEL
jgi:hypothetical protein